MSLEQPGGGLTVGGPMTQVESTVRLEIAIRPRRDISATVAGTGPASLSPRMSSPRRAWRVPQVREDDFKVGKSSKG
jgi:hypothetical protein